MRIIKGQILAGTLIDRQGERNSKNILERFASSFDGKILPLNQHHNLALPTIGHIENLLVTPDLLNDGEWHLIGDVYLDQEITDFDFGGFSFSYMEKLRHCQNQECVEIFLPYPHYNDTSLIDELFEDGYSSVGKIVRKGAAPETIALIVSVVVAVLQPAWEEIYRSKIAPAISDFVQEKFSILIRRNISFDISQHIDYRDHSAEVLFIPARGMESECLSVEKMYSGMLLVADYLNALDVNHVPATKIIVIFVRKEGKFSIKMVHFADGSVENIT